MSIKKMTNTTATDEINKPMPIAKTSNFKCKKLIRFRDKIK